MAGMVVGLGFAAVENVLYALSQKPVVVIPRSLSSVPLHVTTCGLLGYLLASARTRSTTSRKAAAFLGAAIIPYLFHGAFDSLLYSGGRVVYLIGLQIVVMVILLDYALARSQTLPPLELLEAMSLRFEEWETIQREPQYERWILRSMGTKNAEFVPLLRWEIGLTRGLVAGGVLLAALMFLPLREGLMGFAKLGLRVEEQITLFSVLPAAYAVTLLMAGVVNPQYFRSSLIRIPIIADVSFSDGTREYNAIAYDVSSADCLLKTVDDFVPGTPLTMRFALSDFSSPELQGEVIWDNHADPGHPTGTVVRFLSKPSGFRSFLLRYYSFRLLRGVIFNLRIPGFELIRRLFVRPTSVMQEQKRFPAGSVVFEEGELGRQFFLIQKGEVEFFKSIGDGERVSMAVSSAGEVFGEMALVGDQPRAATAVCRTDCVLAVADGDNLEALIENSPAFASRLIRTLSRRMNSSEGILTQSIEALEDTLIARDDFYRLSGSALLLGLGVPLQEGSLHIRANPKLAAAALGVSEEVAARMIRWISAPEGRTADQLRHARPSVPDVRIDLADED